MEYIETRILDSLEQATEGYRYVVRLATIDSPLNGFVPTISLNMWGADFDPIPAAKAEMVKVAEGIPALVVVEADMYPASLAENFPVTIRIEPQTAFLALPTASVFQKGSFLSPLAQESLGILINTRNHCPGFFRERKSMLLKLFRGLKPFSLTQMRSSFDLTSVSLGETAPRISRLKWPRTTESLEPYGPISGTYRSQGLSDQGVTIFIT